MKQLNVPSMLLQSIFHNNCNIRNYMGCRVEGCLFYKVQVSRGHDACRAKRIQLNKCHLTLRKSSLEYAQIVKKFQGTAIWKLIVNFTVYYEIIRILVLSPCANYLLVRHKLHELMKSQSSLTSISPRNTENSNVQQWGVCFETPSMCVATKAFQWGKLNNRVFMSFKFISLYITTEKLQHSWWERNINIWLRFALQHAMTTNNGT